MLWWLMTDILAIIWKEVSSLIKILCRYLPGGTEENHENFRHNTRYLGRHSKQAAFECNSRAISLHQPAGFLHHWRLLPIYRFPHYFIHYSVNSFFLLFSSTLLPSPSSLLLSSLIFSIYSFILFSSAFTSFPSSFPLSLLILSSISLHLLFLFLLRYPDPSVCASKVWKGWYFNI
jgi:hypothetical protein